MNYLIGIALGIVAFIGVSFMQPQSTNYDGKHPSEEMLVGATSFPSSLDSLTNPGATDSVATVSHSGQHANANDAIEALEAKIGIGVSTPLADTIFGGLSTGVSGWFSWATSTRMTAQNLVITASSTIQDFTARNATTTNATSTGSIATSNIIASNIASTSQFYANNLSPCTGSNFLQWTGGVFGCGAGTGGVSTFSTTTSVDLATTTISTALIPTTNYIKLVAYASTTASAFFRMQFNGSNSGYDSQTSLNFAPVGTKNNLSEIWLNAQATNGAQLEVIDIDINNLNGALKTGNFTSSEFATSTPGVREQDEGMFIWRNGDGRITQIDIGVTAGFIGKGTTFIISGY